MFRTALARAVLAGAFLTATSVSALAFNPQPDPPGKIRATEWQVRNLTLCATGAHVNTTSQMTMRNTASPKTEQRKAGGNFPQYTIGHTSTGAQCLNPQPLPPG